MALLWNVLDSGGRQTDGPPSLDLVQFGRDSARGYDMATGRYRVPEPGDSRVNFWLHIAGSGQDKTITGWAAAAIPPAVVVLRKNGTDVATMTVGSSGDTQAIEVDYTRVIDSIALAVTPDGGGEEVFVMPAAGL